MYGYSEKLQKRYTRMYRWEDAQYSLGALAGLLLGGIAALPVYKMLPVALATAPGLFFLTIAMCGAGWLVFSVIMYAIYSLLER